LQYVQMPFSDWFNWREASTAMMAENLPRNGWSPLWPQVNWTGDQPGYQGREFQVLTILAAVLDWAFGHKAWHGRAVAAAFGLMSVVALYAVCLRLYGLRNARFIALVFSLMPGVVAVDSSYLPDPAMLSLCLIAFWLLISGLQAGRLMLFMAAAVIATVAILAKLPALAALPAAIYLVWTFPNEVDRRKRLMWFTIWLCIALLPITAYYRWAIYLGTTYPPYHIAGEGNIWDVGLIAFLKDKFYLRAFFETAVGWLWTQPFMTLAIIGFFPLLGWQQQGKAAAPWFFHFWAAGCLALYIIAARELTSNPHNFHIFNPAVAAFVGFGLAGVCTGLRDIRILQVIRFIALIGILGTGTYTGLKQIMHSPHAEVDYRLGIKLDEFASGDDLVIIAGTEAGNPLPIYYSRQRGWLLPLPPRHLYYDATEEEILENFLDLHRRGGRWFAYSKQARDYSTPSRHFVERYPLLLKRVAEIGDVVAETPEYAIFRLP
jgi:hypothetical protein